MNARRANVREPVEVENPEVTEEVENDNPEVVEDEPETAKADEADVPPVPEDDEPEVEYFDGETPEGVEVSDHWTGEPEPEVEPDLTAEEYIPGQPCRKCGNPSPAYTNSYGRGCNRCLV